MRNFDREFARTRKIIIGAQIVVLLIAIFFVVTIAYAVSRITPESIGSFGGRIAHAFNATK